MQQVNDPKEELLWKQARRRVNFKRSFATYCIVNAFFWALWFFGDRDYSYGQVPWPVWPMLGWGIGIAFQYYKAFMSNEPDAVEKEYEKLRNN
jgi:hypothetical protein